MTISFDLDRESLQIRDEYLKFLNGEQLAPDNKQSSTEPLTNSAVCNAVRSVFFESLDNTVRSVPEYLRRIPSTTEGLTLKGRMETDPIIRKRLFDMTDKDFILGEEWATTTTGCLFPQEADRSVFGIDELNKAVLEIDAAKERAFTEFLEYAQKVIGQEPSPFQKDLLRAVFDGKNEKIETQLIRQSGRGYTSALWHRYDHLRKAMFYGFDLASGTDKAVIVTPENP